MPNIAALAGVSVIGGIVCLIAIWAYEEYQRSYRLERRHSDSTQRPEGSKSRPPPQPPNDCSICHDMLSSPLEILPCGHIFHRQCIKKWFEQRMLCPVCRTRISDEMVNQYIRRLGL